MSSEVTVDVLERELRIAQAGLRKIVRINPYTFEGGPSNRYFGRRHEQAFDKCQGTALKTLQEMENHLNDNEES